MRYTEFLPCFLFSLPSLFSLPYSLFPVPCSLFPKTIKSVPHQIENRYSRSIDF
ncbi:MULTISPECIES: hypothetical protein [Moorena]|nr:MULTISPECIES: hypothetical protein [Moorena]NEP31256.1 hypothetical protein [Moorena sp. SIO3B2]NEQ12563.1 hypothetical protein [Moorena sp. SIO3E2]NER88606.1 hypothetical protein [Moorena sp. SIO3A2]NES46603.1 hypothetical protein [Moorena sp. SIO2C4]